LNIPAVRAKPLFLNLEFNITVLRQIGVFFAQQMYASLTLPG
jgi:hypothetical protein